ncbi:Zn-ribbon domain-containing OB-fold protein [Brevibacterium sp. FAM 24638]|uniref:Zn-ribbon domain-containing OB-fold protein n=1 Tax=Brevibacterium sp. FAM 24638 TaxID=3415681 RepID=UPI003C7AB05B
MTKHNTATRTEQPLPVLEEWNRPFFAAGENGEIRLQVCSRCNRTIYYPRAFCPHCGSQDYNWEPQPLEGTIDSFSRVWKAENPHFDPDLPFHIALVELGNGVKFFGRLRVASGVPAIGDRVSAEFVQINDEVWLPRFVRG